MTPEQAEQKHDGGGSYTQAEEDMIDSILPGVIAAYVEDDDDAFFDSLVEASDTDALRASLVKALKKQGVCPPEVYQELGVVLVNQVVEYHRQEQRALIEEDLDHYAAHYGG